MQRKHLCYSNPARLPVRRRRKGPRYQCEREGQTAGLAAEGRRTTKERASESVEGKGTICPNSVRLWKRHWTGELKKVPV